MDRDLVSVIIPTYNEEKTLPYCLSSVSEQSNANIEVIVIDSDSTDNTVGIAERHGARVIQYLGKPLGARFTGLQNAKGSFVFYLDADQVIARRECVQEAVGLINEGYDAIIFGEDSYNPHTWTEKMLSKERKYMHRELKTADNPLGVLHPRFYRKETIEKVFRRVPQEILSLVFAYDDVIIHRECTKASLKIGFLADAIFHIEEKNIYNLASHWFNIGRSAKKLAKTGAYNELISRKTEINMETIRKRVSNGVFFIGAIKFVAYSLGWFFG